MHLIATLRWDVISDESMTSHADRSLVGMTNAFVRVRSFRMFAVDWSFQREFARTLVRRQALRRPSSPQTCRALVSAPTHCNIQQQHHESINTITEQSIK